MKARNNNYNSMNILLVVFALVLTNCTTSTEPGDTGIDTLAFSQDAMLMDLYLTDEIVPSLNYYERIASDLRQIKRRYFNRYPDMIGLSFKFPYSHNELLIEFDDTTSQKVLAGEYHDWDSLNNEYGLIEVSEGYPGSNLFILEFECCYHMYYLEQLYGELSGLLDVSRNWYVVLERLWNVFPKVRGDTLTYFYDYGRNCDVDWGCSSLEYLYFRSIDGRIEFVGYWEYDYQNYPEWWDEAYENYDDMLGWFWEE